MAARMANPAGAPPPSTRSVAPPWDWVDWALLVLTVVLVFAVAYAAQEAVNATVNSAVFNPGCHVAPYCWSNPTGASIGGVGVLAILLAVCAYYLGKREWRTASR